MGTIKTCDCGHNFKDIECPNRKKGYFITDEAVDTYASDMEAYDLIFEKSHVVLACPDCELVHLSRNAGHSPRHEDIEWAKFRQCKDSEEDYKSKFFLLLDQHEGAVRKLMAEYRRKIDVCDLMLGNIAKNKGKVRAYILDVHYRNLLADQRLWEMRKQAYIQASKDIESLLDVEQ